MLRAVVLDVIERQEVLAAVAATGASSAVTSDALEAELAHVLSVVRPSLLEVVSSPLSGVRHLTLEWAEIHLRESWT